MSTKAEPELPRDRLISLRVGHWALIVGLVSALGALIMSSILSVAAHDAELDGLFSEEGDGTAMTFVQRESFGVVLELDSWARGESTAREVQIARALLGQRLQVITVSGEATYDLTDDAFRDSLGELDEVIRSLEDGPVELRIADRASVSETVDQFTARTRDLSAAFQEITRDRAAIAINNRAFFEQVQGTVAVLAVVLGVVLAVWLAADLRRAYRVASERLRTEAAGLDRARRRLAFHHELRVLAQSWAGALSAGMPTADIVARAESDLRRLLPDVELDLIAGGSAPSRFVVTSSLFDPGTPDPELASDVAAAIDRANETVELAEGRDDRERSFAQERERDALTGLHNRERLQRDVDDALAQARRGRQGAVAALVLFDIQRFADFNSSFGHREGDRLLLEVAHRLTVGCPDGGSVLRLSADEFAVVGAFSSPADAHEQFTHLAHDLAFSFSVGDATTSIAVSAGAVISHSLDDAPDALIQRAAVMLTSGSSPGPRVPVRFFRWELDEHLMEVMHEESALRSALRSGEFIVHYQPIIHLESGAVTASEALVRWNRPGVGLVGPSDFLPGIARAGLTVELGWQIIDLALSTWGAERTAAAGALDQLYLSINLDAAQLEVPTLADYLLNSLDRSGVPPENLVLEVTEHILLVGDTAIAQLDRLRTHGIRVALDDFGTGYSSLSQASSLPLDILKVDRSFMPDPQLNRQQRALLRDIVSMATTLGLLVTSEGVETASVADDLRDLGVAYGQGWHWARAMPIDEFVAWENERRATESLIEE